MRKYYLLVSDFDQTLSFNDSGLVLAEMLGIPDFQAKVANLSRLNLVQSGAELTYLLRHDPEYRRVRREDLVAVGRQIRLKENIERLPTLLARGIDGHRFDFHVVSAAPDFVLMRLRAMRIISRSLILIERSLAPYFQPNWRPGKLSTKRRFMLRISDLRRVSAS